MLPFVSSKEGRERVGGWRARTEEEEGKVGVLADGGKEADREERGKRAPDINTTHSKMPAKRRKGREWKSRFFTLEGGRSIPPSFS